MKRAIATAALLAGLLTFADGPDAGVALEQPSQVADAGVALDSPVQHDSAIEIVEVHDGVIRGIDGVVQQVAGGAYLPHTGLVEVAQKMARLEGENAALRVLIGVAIAIAVASAALAAYEWGRENIRL